MNGKDIDGVEEYPFFTSAIVTSGAPANRAADGDVVASLLHQPQEQAPEPHEGHYIKAAMAIYAGDDYDFDFNPTVSMTEGGGAWVQGWLWVPEAYAVEAMKKT